VGEGNKLSSRTPPDEADVLRMVAAVKHESRYRTPATSAGARRRSADNPVLHETPGEWARPEPHDIVRQQRGKA